MVCGVVWLCLPVIVRQCGVWGIVLIADLMVTRQSGTAGRAGGHNTNNMEHSLPSLVSLLSNVNILSLSEEQTSKAVSTLQLSEHQKTISPGSQQYFTGQFNTNDKR